jgi:hypothetical protein
LTPRTVAGKIRRVRPKPRQTRLRPSTSNGLRGVAAFLLSLACLTHASAFATSFETTDDAAAVTTSYVKGDGAAQLGTDAAAPQSNVKAQGAKTVSARTGATQVNLGAAASTAVNGREAAYGTDDTQAVQNAIGAAQSAGGGTLSFPEGNYLTSGLRVTSPSVRFRGQGWARTRLGNYSPTATTIEVTSNVEDYATAGGVYDVAFVPAVRRAKTANEIKVFVNLPNFTVDGCLFKNVGRAIKLGDASKVTSGYWVRNCRYINCWQFLKLVRVIDGTFRDIVGDLGRLDDPVGIHLDGGSEGNTFDSVIVTNATAYNTYQTSQAAAAGGGTNLLTQEDEYTGQDPAHTFFTNCYFDAAADGAVFNDGRNFSFTNVWFNGTYRYGAYVGAGTTGFSFVNCKFWYSGDSGLLLLGTRHTVRAS